MTEFFAQPYSIKYTGFSFDNIETYEIGMKALKEQGCEEVEIQFIEGANHLSQLADAASIGQGDMHIWFNELEDLEFKDTIRICYLLELGMSMDESLSRFEDVYLYYGTAEDYAYNIINEKFKVPRYLSDYVDYKAFARDMKISGEIAEIKYDLIVINAAEF